jgi:hypothetical protein
VSTVAREAKARLTDLNVQEVSLVDRAANEKKFAIAKRAPMPKMSKADWTAKAKLVKTALVAAMQKLAGDKAAGVAKLEFKLPSEAKQSLMDGLADALDRLTALATMVGDAEVDDGAGVPEELVSALTQVAELLQGTAGQYAAGEAAPAEGGEAPAGEAEGAPAGPPEGPEGKRLQKAELDNLTAATVTIGAAREQLWGVCDLMGKDPAAAAEKVKQIAGMLDSAAGFMSSGGAPAPAAGSAEEKAAKALLVAKGLPSELHDGDSLKGEHRDGDSLKETLQKACAQVLLLDVATAKAGRKIARARYEKLQSLHSTLGSLLNELAYDEAAEGAAGGKATDKAAPAEGEKPGGKPAPGKGGKHEEAPAQKSAGDGDGVAELKKRIADGEAARARLEKQVAELSRRAGVPVSAPVEETAKRGAEGDDAVKWPQDMSADVAKRKAAAKAAGKK